MAGFTIKYSRACLTIVFVCLAFCSNVFGDTPATPCSYSIESSDAVFVMLAPDPQFECLSQGKEKEKLAKKLRQKYSASGLYVGSKALWTLDWYSYEVHLSSDRKHLVRMGPWATAGSTEAFSFFAEGKLLKTYKVEELVPDVSVLPHSVSHFTWERAAKLDDVNGTFEVSTLDGRGFTFDLATGEIRQKGLSPDLGVTSPSFFTPLLWLAGASSVAIVLLLSVLFFRARKRKLRTSPGSEHN